MGSSTLQKISALNENEMKEAQAELKHQDTDKTFQHYLGSSPLNDKDLANLVLAYFVVNSDESHHASLRHEEIRNQLKKHKDLPKILEAVKNKGVKDWYGNGGRRHFHTWYAIDAAHQSLLDAQKEEKITDLEKAQNQKTTKNLLSKDKEIYDKPMGIAAISDDGTSPLDQEIDFLNLELQNWGKIAKALEKAQASLLLQKRYEVQRNEIEKRIEKLRRYTLLVGSHLDSLHQEKFETFLQNIKSLDAHFNNASPSLYDKARNKVSVILASEGTHIYVYKPNGRGKMEKTLLTDNNGHTITFHRKAMDLALARFKMDMEKEYPGQNCVTGGFKPNGSFEFYFHKPRGGILGKIPGLSTEYSADMNQLFQTQYYAQILSEINNEKPVSVSGDPGKKDDTTTMAQASEVRSPSWTNNRHPTNGNDSGEGSSPIPQPTSGP